MRVLLSVVSLFVALGALSAAVRTPTDAWSFDFAGKITDPVPLFASPQHPVRHASLDAKFLAGVPGVVNQGLWCLPGASARLGSAVLVPAKGDFTISFYAGFPESLTQQQLLFRNPKMSIAVTREGRVTATLATATVTGTTPISDGKWHHVAILRRGQTLCVCIDGACVGERSHVTATVYDDLGTQWALLDPENVQRMFLDEVTFYDAALTAEELMRLAAPAVANAAPPTVSEADAAAAVAAHDAANPPFAEEASYPRLKIGAQDLRSFAEQHDVCAAALPWFDPAGRDLICMGSIFGARPLLYRFLRLEKGVPVYAPGVPWTGPNPRDTVCWRGVRDGVALCRAETRKDANDKPRRVLTLYRGSPKTGEFDQGMVIRSSEGDRDFALEGGHFSFADMDGDGVDDLLVATIRGSGDPNGGFPWAGGNPWTDNETPYAGSGRGYDIFGNWMGTEVIAEVKWAKGVRAEDGAPRFGKYHSVLMDMPDYPGVRRALTWKIYMGIMGMSAVDTSEGRQLVLFGDMDRIVSLLFRCEGGEVYCGEPRPLLKDGYWAPHGYWINHLTAIDFDGDGRRELMLDGNPGTVAVLAGDKPGEWASTRAWIEGGDICGETLCAPARFDWDGDGKEDLILTDASGWFTFWGGTDDPLVYRAPRAFTVGGRPLCLKGGDSGSLQGKVERVWGYVKVVAGTWGGRKALLTVDIRGDLLLHTGAAGGDPLALAPAQPFRRADGRPIKVAWRSRVDFVPAGFAGAPRASLLLMDTDGDVAVAVPEAEDSLTLASVEKLHYADGAPIHLCGINGLWGRCHLELVDWDGDGADDILFGSNGSCQRFFDAGREWTRCSSPFFLRNVGTRAKPVFTRPQLVTRRSDGKRLYFGWHNSTPWITDLDGDGKPDLLVGAENGKVYAFKHDEIVCGDTAAKTVQ